MQSAAKSICLVSSRTCQTQTQQLIRSFANGSRGSRGHGWFHKYKNGLGGRHLQGRYHNRDTKKRVAINDQVFAMNSKENLAYLDLKVEDDSKIEGEAKSQRVTIELASDALPKTCENFMALCKSQSGYESTKVFKIEPKAGICMGDVTESNDGSQGSCHSSVKRELSSGSPDTFDHESTILSHAEKGMVSMLSTGLDQNDSRFIITTVDDAPHLDGKYVAFGRVKEGLEVLENLVQNVYTQKGRPTHDIEIVKCGAL